VHFISFLKQQIGQITSILAGNACNKRPFHLAGIVGRFAETPMQEDQRGV
jgi:hypothetical protein